VIGKILSLPALPLAGNLKEGAIRFSEGTAMTNHGYESPKQDLETNSAAKLRGTDPAWGGRAQRS